MLNFEFWMFLEPTEAWRRSSNLGIKAAYQRRTSWDGRTRLGTQYGAVNAGGSSSTTLSCFLTATLIKWWAYKGAIDSITKVGCKAEYNSLSRAGSTGLAPSNLTGKLLLVTVECLYTLSSLLQFWPRSARRQQLYQISSCNCRIDFVLSRIL